MFKRDCSEHTAEEIDEEVKALLNHTYVEAKDILIQHRDQLEHVTEELLKRETLDGRTFRELIGMPDPSNGENGADISGAAMANGAKGAPPSARFNGSKPEREGHADGNGHSGVEAG